jgi:putative oxidoreductase
VRAGRLIASSPREVERSETTTEGVRVKTAKSRGARVNDLAPMIVRLAQGSLMAGHGAQKLFGSFGGPGLEGTSGFMEMLGMRPGRPWAYLAGLSEFGGGVLTALGLLNPLGPLGIIASMSMATRKAHWGKPIWVTEGGAELPVLNIAISTALMIREPDRYSLDRVLGIRLPRWVGLVGLVGIILTVLYAELGAEEAPEQEQEAHEEAHEEAQEEEAQDEAREELAGP